MITITIDGLSTTGKTTLAKLISQKYGFKNFNTGGIYRCIALVIIENHLDIRNIEEILKYIENMHVDFRDDKVYLNELDVTKEIQEEKVSILSTKWATIKEIKNFVRQYQKDFIKNNNTVMEGRDIGSRIAPAAFIKFYLYSNFEKRVERLWNQNKKINKEIIRKNLITRDNLDINGGNFIKPVHAIEIDTTNFTIEELFFQMTTVIDEKLKKEVEEDVKI